MTILTLGSALTDTSLTAPVVRSATSADLLSGSMISPLVLSRQPCITPGAGHALGNGLGGSGGGGGGVDDGRGFELRFGGERLRLGFVEAAHIPTRRATPRTAGPITPRMGRRSLMQARLRIVRRCAPRSRPRRDEGLANRLRKRRANPRFVGD